MATLVIKSIEFVDLSRLVIASQQKEVFGIFDFIGKQKNDRFNGLFAPIDVIS